MTTHTPDKPERPRTLGRTVHEKYPAAVVGEASELTLVEGGERGGAPGPTESEHTTNSPCLPGERDAYRDDLTHVDEHGDVRMVDVGDKQVTKRIAIAEGTILMHPETQAMVLEDRAKKGDVLACARVAGIMASKAHERPHPHVPPAQHHQGESRDRAHLVLRGRGPRLGAGARGPSRGLPRARHPVESRA